MTNILNIGHRDIKIICNIFLNTDVISLRSESTTWFIHFGKKTKRWLLFIVSNIDDFVKQKKMIIIHCVQNTWFGKTKKHNRISWNLSKNDLDE